MILGDWIASGRERTGMVQSGVTIPAISASLSGGVLRPSPPPTLDSRRPTPANDNDPFTQISNGIHAEKASIVGELIGQLGPTFMKTSNESDEGK